MYVLLVLKKMYFLLRVKYMNGPSGLGKFTCLVPNSFFNSNRPYHLVLLHAWPLSDLKKTILPFFISFLVCLLLIPYLFI